MDIGLLLSFILLCRALPLSAEEDSKSTESNTTTCPENFNCGNLAGVGFPFFDSSHSCHCGFFKLNCKAMPSPKFVFEFTADEWVDALAIGNSAITLHDNILEHLLDRRSCESFDHSIMPLPNYPSISYSILPNITLYRCTKNPETSQKLADFFSGYKQYDKCDEPDNGLTIYYQTPQHHAPTVNFSGDIQSLCKNVTLPVVSRHNYSVNADLFQLLTAEFDLEWHLSEDCYACNHEGRECLVDWNLPLDPRCVYSKKAQPSEVIYGGLTEYFITSVRFSFPELQRKTDYQMTICRNKETFGHCSGNSCFAGGLGILVILAYFFQRKYSFLRIWSQREKFQNVEDFLKDYGSLAPKRYHYSEVKKMTNSFVIKLGQGGYGCVYKGKLQDGSPVAVKVLKELKGSGEEFVNEVASISRTSHINVVTLLGFCFQGRKRALVYEFMPNGSLEKFIYGEVQLGWQILYKIAVGIARGLEYLHRGCNTRILHFDIKPHNILLDENFCPKISDFGLAKLCLQNESIVSILGARGTVGYIAPEVFCKNFGAVSHKSDVYSYGMMVFEMVGGSKNIDVGVDHSSEIYFPHWIYARLDRGEQELGLHGISNEEENELARKMIIVSLWCIQTDPVNRPSMTKVVEMLEGNLHALETPPKPFLSSPARASEDSSTIYPSGTVS
ncbi:LEAF RUST 10 DISEASE-RESISTANCE LOCUS RECEPTOR-LIKE PROTEIN KINASE-like 2.1 [Coffea eugenioides]|uniref:LEAF RUST 10 DISEASE-RESISTANCE LOCUS RECEPTOR-LIKE PROTEIN KINASE-like 2.1 n=1 Tax=Coffea eugenioides TaxID=49369 RepID=UPI000F6132CF|nr:LEAF RUST 10 DISEASE-RESISTANCE LOCUS RECEPTOR-LIKE PROTEIN KINASE-like 2.1 [Coffea eugenioides]